MRALTAAAQWRFYKNKSEISQISSYWIQHWSLILIISREVNKVAVLFCCQAVDTHEEFSLFTNKKINKTIIHLIVTSMYMLQ